MVIAAVWGIGSLAVLIGTFAPWAETSAGEITGVEGVGLPVAVLAALTLVLAIVRLVNSARLIAVAVFLAAATSAVICWASWLVIRWAGRSSELLAWVLSRDEGEPLLEDTKIVMTTWGLPLAGVGACCVAVAAVVAALAGPRSDADPVEPLTDDVPVPALDDVTLEPHERWR